MEATRPIFCEVVAHGARVSEKFAAAIIPDSAVRFTNDAGTHDLVLGIRTEFPTWEMPEKTAEQMKKSRNFWAKEH